MKRKRINLLCAILSVTMVILLCPPIAFAEDAIPDAKMLSYEDYFENEHGFYLDTITKSKQYLNMSTGLFSPLVQKEANGTITRNGQEVTGIIGNSEIVFFAIDHTVYRYHVKSKRIDAVFTEPMMESFYPITSHVVLWTKASTPANAKGLCTDCVSDNSLCYTFDVRTQTSSLQQDPERILNLTRASGYTNLSSYTMVLNGKQIPRPLAGYRINDIYPGANECEQFGLEIYAYLWGSQTYGTYLEPGGCSSASDVFNSVDGLPKGSYMRFYNKKTNYRHTMIKLQTFSMVGKNYIDVYHANFSTTHNLVTITRFTAEQFYDYFDTYVRARTPN